MARGGGQPAPKPPKQRTIQLRQFKGVNLTDSRVAIGNDEFAWLENAMTIGNGAIQLLNASGPSIATIAPGIARLFGRTLSGMPIFIVVGSDGSLTQLTPGGVLAIIAPAGTVGPAPVIAVWRGTTILILDAVTGFHSWDGAAYVLIDATRVGTALAVFQGRAVIVNGRTITLSSPNTFNDFNPANGATTTILTDEAFPGNITAAVSALEQCWLIGDGAVEALANIVTTTGPTVTTFSLTNIVSNLGSNARESVIGYFRALAFLAPFGAYALSGVTPQKISEKLDGLFPFLTVGASVSSAVAVVQNLLCLIFNVTYTGQDAQAGAGPRPLQLVFTGGKWCFASQGGAVWITDILINGVAQAWATDGSHVYRMFGAPDSQDVTYKIQWKLSDFGLATTMKACMKTGLEFQSAYSVAPRMTIDNETSAQEVQNLQTTVDVTWVNTLGQPVQFVNTSGQAVTWAAQGMVLSRQSSAMAGRYLGWTITGTHPIMRIQAVQMEIVETRTWATPGTAG